MGSLLNGKGVKIYVANDFAVSSNDLDGQHQVIYFFFQHFHEGHNGNKFCRSPGHFSLNSTAEIGS